MKHVLLTLLVVILSASLYSQTDTATTKINAAEITFEKDFYDLGQIKNGADFHYIFEFTNTGNEPLQLENVGWGMGYMMFMWPKDPILPGKKGTIKFSYDTKRVGRANKSMTVLSNAKTRTKVIQFTLEVLPPKIVTGPEITFEKDVINLDTVPYAADCPFLFEFTNTGKEPLIISDVQEMCGCHVGSWSKEPILPGQRGTIKVSYDTKRVGPNSHKVTIISNAINEPAKALIPKIYVLPFSGPELNFSKENYDIGTVAVGKWLHYEFPFNNGGTEPLIIKEISGNEYTIYTWPAKPVMPGESGVIKLDYFAYRAGRDKNMAYIRSNAKDNYCYLHYEVDVLPDKSLRDSTKTITKWGALAAFDAVEIDLGELEIGTDTACDFTFTNIGTDYLDIKEATCASRYVTAICPTNVVLAGKGSFVHAEINADEEGVFAPIIQFDTMQGDTQLCVKYKVVPRGAKRNKNKKE